MSDVALRASTRFEIRADRILKVAAQSWFVVAAVGLWIFASSVALLYVL